MTIHEKKIKERIIASAVYEANLLQGLMDHEKPDLVGVVEPRCEAEFGVEVTELYLSEPAARLENIPGYLSQVFAGQYSHRDDPKALPIEEVILKRHSTGGEEKLTALVQRLPDEERHLELLAEAINSKTRKAINYRPLHHLNLIVLDRSRRWRKIENSTMCSMLGHPPITAATWRSPFREIFFVAELQGQWYYLPIVFRHLLAEFFGFLAVSCRTPNTTFGCQRDLLMAFGQHLRRISAEAVMMRGTGAELEILHRRYGVLIREERGVVIRDYLDAAYPEDHSPLGSNDHLSDTILDTREHHKDFVFKMDLAVRAHKNPLHRSEEQ